MPCSRVGFGFFFLLLWRWARGSRRHQRHRRHQRQMGRFLRTWNSPHVPQYSIRGGIFFRAAAAAAAAAAACRWCRGPIS